MRLLTQETKEVQRHVLLCSQHLFTGECVGAIAGVACMKETEVGSIER